MQRGVTTIGIASGFIRVGWEVDSGVMDMMLSLIVPEGARIIQHFLKGVIGHNSLLILVPVIWLWARPGMYPRMLGTARQVPGACLPVLILSQFVSPSPIRSLGRYPIVPGPASQCQSCCQRTGVMTNTQGNLE